MLRILLSIIMMTPLIVIVMGQYRSHPLILLASLLLFIVGMPMFIYFLATYIVDKGIRVPQYTMHDEIIRIRSQIEDKWRNK